MSQPNQDSLFPNESAKAQAKLSNLRFIQQTEKRANKEDGVLGPCLNAYLQHASEVVGSPEQLLDNLTKWLIEAKDETEALIRDKMIKKWADNPENIQSSITNSMRRSAGSNYQSLVSFALAKFLVETNSAWYVQQPVPVELRQALTITFTANVDEPQQETESTEVLEVATPLNNDEPVDTIAGDVKVQPDVDILLRNAGWNKENDGPEPVILLSVKTSLVDRAGMAARWKTYFDLATRPCPLHDQAGCVYDRLGIEMKNTKKYAITHGIVTANIYKLWFHDKRYQAGELATGQTRSNTYMFELKITTRNDELAYTPPDWRQLPAIADTLRQLSTLHGLPE
jgi:hypothetical protein